MVWMAIVATCLVPIVWPGDVPFINDEPLLIARAVDANQKGVPAETGLLGTYDVVYGPVPIWVYQPLVAVTHNLVVIAVLHALLMAATTAGALWWLSRSLRFWVWFVPVPLLSPYFWFYARVLWDNPFLIPLGALAIAGYAAFLNSGSPGGLRVSVAAITAIPLVHLMGLALVVPLAAHIAAVRWRGVWAHRVSLAVMAVPAAALAWPYLKYLASRPMPSPAPVSSIDGWIFPLFGGRLLSAHRLDYFFGPGPVDGRMFGAVAAISCLAYALVWSGIGIAGWRALAAVRSRTWTPRDHLAVILLGAVASQAVLDGLSARFQHPQYYNATWIAFALLAWIPIDAAAKAGTVLRWSATVATGLLAGVLLVGSGTVALRLHRSSGTRETYGPTIANQQQVARALARYSPQSRLSIRVVHYNRFPHTLAILRQLTARQPYGHPERDLEIRYRSDDPASGAIELVER
jgi:hypothetical protein